MVVSVLMKKKTYTELKQIYALTIFNDGVFFAKIVNFCQNSLTQYFAGLLKKTVSNN